MEPLADRIAAANTLLAPYAVPHQGLLGRVHQEPEDERRTPFQRDRDRIAHSQAFRRLQGKTQVFVAGKGDHFRTRLTHTFEVALVSRDLARAMGLNEDLAECIALAHDLGHPPFGHAGEEAIDTWMQTQGLAFEHNEQSLRVVTVLESHSSLYEGLNVQREIVEGLQKHDRPNNLQHTLEAQLVNIADEIAYTAHDCEDGLEGNLFTMEALQEIPLMREVSGHTVDRGTAIRGAIIRFLVSDVLDTSTQNIARSGIDTLDDVRALPETLIRFSMPVRAALKEWRSFFSHFMYHHPSVAAPMEEGQQLLLRLCDALFHAPSDKILALQQRTGTSLAEAVKDYVAGMTDAFAIETGKDLGL